MDGILLEAQMLLNSQRNDLANIFSKAGLKVADASITFVDKPDPTGLGVVAVIGLSNAKYLFQIESKHGSDRYQVFSRPNISFPWTGDKGYLDGYLWEWILWSFEKWAVTVKEDLETPDLWKELSVEQTESLKVFDKYDIEGPIPEGMKTILKASLMEFQVRLLENLPTKEDQKAVSDKMDQVIAGLDSSTYLQWRMFFYQFLISLMFSYPESQGFIKNLLLWIGQTVAKEVYKLR
jgi:hypothetical protein